MIDVNDYNGDYFFEAEAEWLEYQSIMDDYEEPAPQDKDQAYIIFTLEQAVSTINELGNSCSKLSIICERTIEDINELIKQYTEKE